MIDIENLRTKLAKAEAEQAAAAAEYRLDPDSNLKWENAYKLSRIVVNIEDEIQAAKTQNENDETKKRNQENEEI